MNQKDFTNLYSLSKTLRFELRPIGKTLNNIKSTGILAEDNHRAESYKKVKIIIDKYHKNIIERVLSTLSLVLENHNKQDSLQEFHCYYELKSKDEKQLKKFEKIQSNLRKQIANAFKEDSKFKGIDKEDLIKKELLDFVTTDEDRALVTEFKNFTTYFKGFHENRMNMYSDEAKASAIAYRLIHENLPKFIDNIHSFQKIASSPIADKLAPIYNQYAKEGYMNANNLSEMFDLKYYNMVLTQAQIEIYNTVIGGKTEKDGSKTQGLNEYINLYNQQQKNKEDRLPKLKILFKQILSDREQVSWLQEEFSTDQQMLSSINGFYQSLVIADTTQNRSVTEESTLGRIKLLLQSIADYDLNKIYLDSKQLSHISQQMFGDWNMIQRAIEQEYDSNQLNSKNRKKDEKRKEKHIKSLKSVSIGFLNQSLSFLEFGSNKTIESYIASLSTKKKEGDEGAINLLDQIVTSYEAIKSILTEEWPEERNIAQEKEQVALIKTFLDSIKELQHFIKPLLGNGDEPDKDDRFYGEFIPLWEQINKITPLYNKVRNRITRKPYSTQKIKLNFQNTQLLHGWDINKEVDNTSVILRKDGLYYLAIMNKKSNKVFNKDLPSDGECYEKMDYKLLPGANKMLPKVFFSKSRIDEFAPSDEILAKYEQGTHKKGDYFSLQDCHNLIDFFKASIEKHHDWRNFEFQFSSTNTYKDLSDFYREVENQGYKVSFRNVSVDYINTLVNEGKLYLFQIYNKDFSPHSKGTPNMHTLYWKMLFDERNLADVVYKLNGEAEVFFRKASLEKKITHPAHQPIKNKNPENPKKEKTFEYDLIKDKRYTEDKFQLHVPITMNFKSSNSGNINALVNNYIRSTKDLHFIGIDRGERHLLYICIIDSKGNIKDRQQFSLNELADESYKNAYPTNYHALLTQREKEREKERQSWKTIEKIKDLKQGYLSQVVHKVSELIIKYNAIVVLEDLNMGFKRGRQKIESSVYQQFEKSLIDKLNYLVDKKLPADADGGVLHAYQLTNKFESFQKMGKQNGFLFYIPAWNTSKMDPVTGFVNLFDTRYENIAKAQKFFRKFDSIRYNQKKDWFELEFDYNSFTTKAEGSRTKWTLCTWGHRIKNFRNTERNASWDYKEVNLTEEYKALFEQFSIDYKNDIKEEILKQNSKEFFENLLALLRLTLQMRNSIPNSTTDYLISPVADADGHFYWSEECGENLPKNADANGAYNIARKGLWMARQIQHSDEGDKINLTISNKEWLKFAQEKPYLKDE
ncbi:MAG: type V CRISPR-associated protein Cas12a/Cpf1 [Porphyromonas sp.]|nr:type V CRISPR-associated protein Cas12a/Cpf1 [Porphyromonas sp.]